jgi:hypothetical protein
MGPQVCKSFFFLSCVNGKKPLLSSQMCNNIFFPLVMWILKIICGLISVRYHFFIFKFSFLFKFIFNGLKFSIICNIFNQIKTRYFQVYFKMYMGVCKLKWPTKEFLKTLPIVHSKIILIGQGTTINHDLLKGPTWTKCLVWPKVMSTLISGLGHERHVFTRRKRPFSNQQIFNYMSGSTCLQLHNYIYFNKFHVAHFTLQLSLLFDSVGKCTTLTIVTNWPLIFIFD